MESRVPPAGQLRRHHAAGSWQAGVKTHLLLCTASPGQLQRWHCGLCLAHPNQREAERVCGGSKLTGHSIKQGIKRSVSVHKDKSGNGELLSSGLHQDHHARYAQHFAPGFLSGSSERKIRVMASVRLAGRGLRRNPNLQTGSAGAAPHAARTTQTITLRPSPFCTDTQGVPPVSRVKRRLTPVTRGRNPTSQVQEPSRLWAVPMPSPGSVRQLRSRSAPSTASSSLRDVLWSRETFKKPPLPSQQQQAFPTTCPKHEDLRAARLKTQGCGFDGIQEDRHERTDAESPTWSLTAHNRHRELQSLWAWETKQKPLR